MFAPSPVNSLIIFRNGLLQTQGFDFSMAGNVITFLAGSIPQAGDELTASYRYANPNNVLGTLTAAQVICSGAGNGTSAIVATTLGSCTIPAGLLTTGDRVEVQFYYLHTGTASTFTGELHWGAATILARTSVASETALAGHVTFAILASYSTLGRAKLGQQLCFGEFGWRGCGEYLAELDRHAPCTARIGHRRRHFAQQLHRNSLPGADQPVGRRRPSWWPR